MVEMGLHVGSLNPDRELPSVPLVFMSLKISGVSHLRVALLFGVYPSTHVPHG